MKTLSSVQDIIALQTENGIVPAVQESAPIAQIAPALLQPYFINRNGAQGFQGPGWRLSLAMGANPMQLTGTISILEGTKNDKPWKMLIVR
jgi:hypothetical protein